VVELQNEGFEVVIVDDLSTLKVLDGIDAITGKIPAFEKLDLRIETKYRIFFKRNNDISGVIHFAASKLGESVENPLLYYENNVSALVYVLQELQMTEANFILVHLVLFTVKPKNADY
jgi:UDP-glucose 4-epimerase